MSGGQRQYRNVPVDYVLYVTSPYISSLYDTTLHVISQRFTSPYISSLKCRVRFITEKQTATKSVFVTFLNLLIARIFGPCFMPDIF
jgi:hypothetical protein